MPYNLGMSDYTPDLQGRAILMVSDYVDENYDEEDLKEEKEFLKEIKRDLKKFGIKFHFLEFKTLAELKRRLKKFNRDEVVVFNWADEIYGLPNTGHVITSFFEENGYRYSGASTQNLLLSMDRRQVSKVLKKKGVSVPKQHNLKKEKIDFPIIVKARYEHGSFGMSRKSVVSNKKELRELLKEINYEHFIGEKYIDGPEYTISVWGNNEPEILTICDIRFESNAGEKFKIIDYKSKWDKSDGGYHGIYSAKAESIEKDIQKKLTNLIKKAYRALECKGFTRFEVRVEGGKPYLIDFNPNPNFRPGTAFIKSANDMGYNLGQIVAKLCQFALDG